MNRTWKQSLATIPGVGISLLPKLTCPFCWPAYAGLLSSVGLGFLISAEYLLPVTAAFLVVAVGASALRANQRHGYWPFCLGLFAALGVLAGNFLVGIESHNVRVSGSACDGFGVERMASSTGSLRLLCGKNN